jgi:hypothetical protein
VPIPTAQDHALARVDELASLVLLKLKVWHRSVDRDPRAVREALRAYADAVQDFVEE